MQKISIALFMFFMMMTFQAKAHVFLELKNGQETKILDSAQLKNAKTLPEAQEIVAQSLGEEQSDVQDVKLYWIQGARKVPITESAWNLIYSEFQAGIDVSIYINPFESQ